jgi:ribosome maturation factor RimP
MDSVLSQIEKLLASLLAAQGYELVHLEIHGQRQKILRLFIDFLPSSPPGAEQPVRSIGIEDCTQVSRALDETLELIPELNALFHGAPYELEVSSPGLDRPLWRRTDYERFAGRPVRVHTFRPLTAEEACNPGYQLKNPRQKHFVGVLLGVASEGIRLSIPEDGGARRRPGSHTSSLQTAAEEIHIPFALIAKANLEPDFDAVSGALEPMKASKRA